MVYSREDLTRARIIRDSEVMISFTDIGNIESYLVPEKTGTELERVRNDISILKSKVKELEHEVSWYRMAIGVQKRVLIKETNTKLEELRQELEFKSEARVAELALIEIAQEPAIRVNRGEVFLFTIGGICLSIGIGFGIWPVALAGLGPLILAAFDIVDRARGKRNKK